MSSVSIARQRGLFAGIADQEVPTIRRDISRLREQISTGKRVNRPSDAPDAFAVAKEMKTLGNRLDRRLSTINSARTFADRTQQELDGMIDLFSRAREEGVRAANDSLSDDDREAIAQELRSIKAEVVDRMNAQQDGEYIFAGNRTDKKPFTDDGTPNYTDGGGDPTHDPISGDRTRQIGKDQELTVNIDGKELDQYGTTPSGDPKTITGALDTLIKAVDPADNTPGPGSDPDIRPALGDVKDALDHVISKGSKAGTIGKRLSIAEEQVESVKLDARERQSDAEDADLAKVASNLQQKQTQLQAALRAVASSKQQASLVNLLG